MPDLKYCPDCGKVMGDHKERFGPHASAASRPRAPTAPERVLDAARIARGVNPGRNPDEAEDHRTKHCHGS